MGMEIMMKMRDMMLCGLVLLGATTQVRAATEAKATPSTLPLIDDFSTGPVTINLNGAGQTADLVKTVSTSGARIVGGKRQTSFELPVSGNPFRLNAQLQIKGATASAPAALTTAGGFQMSSRIDIVYGNYVDRPLNVDLRSYDRFRVHFLALDGDQDLVLQTFAAAGDGEWGCSLSSSPYYPVVVDFPFANSPGAALFPVTEIALISQGGAYGYEAGISYIEVVPAGTPQADITCPAITDAIRKRLRPWIATRG
jgi:hypothetical protein